MKLKRQKGQMLPFWGLAVTCLVSLVFFMTNYANVVAWQIRAINAADGAAAVGTAQQGSTFNQQTTILYSIAVDENRMRFLNQAILNTIYGAGGCAGQSGACSGNYVTLVAEFNKALTAYQNDMALLTSASNFAPSQDQGGAATSVGYIGDCAVTDCAFAFTVRDSSALSDPNCQNEQFGQWTTTDSCGNPPQQIDVVACHKIPIIAAALFGLGANGKFTAVGRSAAIVNPTNKEVFSPGTAINPMTNQVYQPLEPQWAATYPSSAYTVDYSGLHVHANWYSVTPETPYTGPLAAGSYACS